MPRCWPAGALAGTTADGNCCAARSGAHLLLPKRAVVRRLYPTRHNHPRTLPGGVRCAARHAGVGSSAHRSGGVDYGRVQRGYRPAGSDRNRPRANRSTRLLHATDRKSTPVRRVPTVPDTLELPLSAAPPAAIAPRLPAQVLARPCRAILQPPSRPLPRLAAASRRPVCQHGHRDDVGARR